MGESKKKKIVVLGAGQSALTAVFQLTHPKNPHRDEYDVTIYQFGWRIGGKGAAGRNLEEPYHYRIEEHGLHNWFGFYDNSFRQIQDCYAELNRIPDVPLATWEEAFEPANEAVFTEEVDGKYLPWVIKNPPNPAVPGSGGVFLPLWDYVIEALEMMWGAFKGTEHAKLGADEGIVLGASNQAIESIGKLGIDLGEVEGTSAGAKMLYGIKEMAWLASEREEAGVAPDPDHVAIKATRRAIQTLPDAIENRFDRGVQRAVRESLRAFMDWLWKRIGPTIAADTDARRLWILGNFFYACIAGCIDEGVIWSGFGVLDEYNFRDFVQKYAFPDGGLTIDSPVMRAVYDSSFAYVDGDMSIPPGASFPPKAQYEAGTALRGMVRATFTYKGAFGWRFAAGTADTCYAPMYLVLKARGVKIVLFHRVEKVECADEAGSPIDSISIARQVDLAVREYDPFVEVKGLPCWPSEPRWEQIVDGEKLRKSGVDLEQTPKDFVDAGKITLRRGVDFDDVILGISIAALPWICGSLIRKSPKWAAMIEHVKTVRTQAVQLWSKPTAYQLGFTIPGRPIASWQYDDASPLNVWGDLSELVPFEGWTVKDFPLNVAYFCSAMPDDPVPDGPPPPPVDPAKEDEKVRTTAIAMLENGLGILWKNAWRDGQKGAFKWDVLLDARPGEHVGRDRFDAQYWRANVALTERYVLSVPGSSKHRIQAHDPNEFSNLYVCGDWTWCNLNSGCMEAATMSGMLCSLALSGFPQRSDITGVDFG